MGARHNFIGSFYDLWESCVLLCVYYYATLERLRSSLSGTLPFFCFFLFLFCFLSEAIRKFLSRLPLWNFSRVVSPLVPSHARNFYAQRVPFQRPKLMHVRNSAPRGFSNAIELSLSILRFSFHFSSILLLRGFVRNSLVIVLKISTIRTY